MPTDFSRLLDEYFRVGACAAEYVQFRRRSGGWLWADFVEAMQADPAVAARGQKTGGKQRLSVSESALRGWLKGKDRPKRAAMEAMADVLLGPVNGPRHSDRQDFIRAWYAVKGDAASERPEPATALRKSPNSPWAAQDSFPGGGISELHLELPLLEQRDNRGGYPLGGHLILNEARLAVTLSQDPDQNSARIPIAVGITEAELLVTAASGIAWKEGRTEQQLQHLKAIADGWRVIGPRATAPDAVFDGEMFEGRYLTWLRPGTELGGQITLSLLAMEGCFVLLPAPGGSNTPPVDPDDVTHQRVISRYLEQGLFKKDANGRVVLQRVTLHWQGENVDPGTPG